VPQDQQLIVDTPEQVALELPIAGIGSRFLAVAVDTLLQAAIYFFGVFALALATRLLGGARLFRGLSSSLFAVLIIFIGFSVYWAYFALFEIFWNGQTPGKRWTGIRVIKDTGRPINAYESIARNVLRAIDFLPGLYAIGVVVMMLDRSSRRLGDFVAGTIVVYDRRGDDIPSLHGARDDDAAPLPQISAEELALIETYLMRRSDLDPLVRDEMAGQIIQRVSRRTAIRPATNQSRDEFLELVARRARDAARFRP
jgi:uncharacterized RDD family membrane protein YckC